MFRFTLRSCLLADFQRLLSWFWRPMGVSEMRRRSSANNSKNSSINSGETIAPCFPSRVVLRASSLIKNENSTGLHTSPCFTPRLHSINSESLFPLLTRASQHWSVTLVVHGQLLGSVFTDSCLVLVQLSGLHLQCTHWSRLSSEWCVHARARVRVCACVRTCVLSHFWGNQREFTHTITFLKNCQRHGMCAA